MGVLGDLSNIREENKTLKDFGEECSVDPLRERISESMCDCVKSMKDPVNSEKVYKSVMWGQVDSEQMFDLIIKSIQKLFEKKNKAYGNIFAISNRAEMRNELWRKFKRYDAQFSKNRNGIMFDGDESVILPTMVDIASYAVMIIINEILNDDYNLSNVLNQIESGSDIFEKE